MIGRILEPLGGTVHLVTAYRDRCCIEGILSIRSIGNPRRRG